MSKTALETVQAFQESIGNGTNDWENLLAEDIQFVGPVDQVSGRAANIELNKGFAPLMRGYEPIVHFEQGNHVLLEGVFTVATPSGGTIELKMAEVNEVVDEKIQHMRVYYVDEEFRKEFAPKN